MTGSCPSCWRCGAQLELPESLLIGFQAVCDSCGAWLHCCAACRFYAPGRANDCLIPDTDLIRDREAKNFCDDYKIRLDGENPKPGKTKEDVARLLFGDDEPDEKDDKGNAFDALFKD